MNARKPTRDELFTRLGAKPALKQPKPGRIARLTASAVAIADHALVASRRSLR